MGLPWQKHIGRQMFHLHEVGLFVVVCGGCADALGHAFLPLETLTGGLRLGRRRDPCHGERATKRAETQNGCRLL